MRMPEGDLLGQGGAHRAEKSSESLTSLYHPSVHTPSAFQLEYLLMVILPVHMADPRKICSPRAR